MSTARPLADHDGAAHNEHNDLEAQDGATAYAGNGPTPQSLVFVENPFADPPSYHMPRISFTSIYSTDDDYKLQAQAPQPTPVPRRKKKTRFWASKLFWIVFLVLLVIVVLSIVFTMLMVGTKKSVNVHGPDSVEGLSKPNNTLTSMRVDGPANGGK